MSIGRISGHPHEGTLRAHVDALKCRRAMERAGVLAILNNDDPQTAMISAMDDYIIRSLAEAFIRALTETIRTEMTRREEEVQ